MGSLNLAQIWHTKNPLFPGGFCNISILGGSHPSLSLSFPAYLDFRPVEEEIYNGTEEDKNNEYSDPAPWDILEGEECCC